MEAVLHDGRGYRIAGLRRRPLLKYGDLGLAHLPETTASGILEEEITSPLPVCTMGQSYIMQDMVMAPYGRLDEIMRDIDVKDDFRHYAEAEIAWTERYFDALPTCAEAVEVTLLMHRILSDYSASFALLVANVEFADIPYVAEIHKNEALLVQWMAEFTE